MKENGLIVWLIDKMFYALKLLPPQRWVEERVKHQVRIHRLSNEDRARAVYKRLVKSEKIIVSFYLLYMLLATVFNFYETVRIGWKIAILIILTLRLIDIVQVNINIALFDDAKIQKKLNAEKRPKVFVYSHARTIILVSINFIEIGLIFGFYYFLLPNGRIVNSSTFSDFFYFSFVSQLTIGYGDMAPCEFFKFLVVIQTLLGFFFSILILSRFISLLPKIASNQEVTKERENNSTHFED